MVVKKRRPALLRNVVEARRQAREAEHPRAAMVKIIGGSLCVSLKDGRGLLVPLSWFPKLLAASAEDLFAHRLIADGEGIHWPHLDEDLSVAGLLRGRPFCAPYPTCKVGKKP